ncbi:MAG: hypothetical protein PHQ20_02815, partial [Candidatus Moranbacteria bacterium]|nr:hypothetical protein [Candidatus Moranbacteria bacterium]
FLDDDLRVEDNFVAQMRKYAKEFDGFTFHMIQKGPVNTFSFAEKHFLKRISSPLIGKVLPFMGLVFGGFYIKSKKIRKIDHMMGCCIIYDFSKNREKRFDMNLNEGNYSGEDTEFSYGLKKSGNELYFVGSHTFVHDAADFGGCRSKDRSMAFFWYWKHKLYIIRKYHSKSILFFARFSCFFESLLLSVFLKKNLIGKYFKALK